LSSLDEKLELIRRNYSDLFVDCDDPEVQHFFWLLSLFLAKCDSILTPIEVRELEGKSIGTTVFSPYFTPEEKREPILLGLKYLKTHNISKPKEIMRVLAESNLGAEKVSSSSLKYLEEFTRSPDGDFTCYAHRLGVNISSVTRAYQKLKKDIGFRFGFWMNFPVFRLKHLVLYFRPNEWFTSDILFNQAFTRTLSYDTFGEWMWASFLVPNQERILREFASGLSRLSDRTFRDHRLYEVKSMGRSYNLTMFDGRKWLLSKEAFGIGLFEYARTCMDIIPCLQEFKYGDGSIRFDQLDFFLSASASSDALVRVSELIRLIKENGFGDLSPITVTRRLARLRQRGALFPISGFFGLGLNNQFAFAAECNDRTAETLFRALPMFPESWAFRTDRGVIGTVAAPAEMTSAVSYTLQRLKDEVDELILTSRFMNVGSRNQHFLSQYWNAEKQYWEFERGFFDISKPIEQH
jgi:hypothetical protein